MNQRDAKSTQWMVAIAIALAFLLAYPLRYVLLPFVAAGALAYVARPLIALLHVRLHMPRWLAALIPLLLFLGGLIAIGYGIGSLLGPQLVQLINNAQTVTQKLLESLFGTLKIKDVQLFGQKLDPAVAAAQLTNAIKQAVGANALLAIGGGIGAIMGCALTIAILAFLLFTGPQLTRGTLWLVPPHLRPRVRALALEVDPMLGNYLRGFFVIVLFTSAITYVVAGLIFHVKLAILLSLSVGLLELIPVIGPVLSFVAFGLVAVEQTSIATIIGFGVFAIVLRLTIDQLVGPLVLGRAARIPAIVVIFAFLAGGALYGMLGIVLAIPVAATIKIVLTDLYEGTSVGQDLDGPILPVPPSSRAKVCGPFPGS
jgi:predicted PurR-regulated permease PerM